MTEKENKDSDLEKELEALYRKVASTDPKEDSSTPLPQLPAGTSSQAEPWLSEGANDSPIPIQARPTHRLFLGAATLLFFLALLGMSAIFFWPTIYYYESLSLGGKAYPIRINKLTGDTRYFNGTAWLSPPVIETVKKPVSENPNKTSVIKPPDQNYIKAQAEDLKDVSPRQNIGGKAKYVIQIKSFPESQKKDALEFMEEMKKKMPDIQMKTSHIPGHGVWHRIWVGNFMSMKEASDSKKKLALSDSYHDSFIRLKTEE